MITIVEDKLGRLGVVMPDTIARGRFETFKGDGISSHFPLFFAKTTRFSVKAIAPVKERMSRRKLTIS